ncbi:MAG: hypothetical protein LQ343_001583 [Gyalolechia ehrenbergii]|nr:MAG: hypothetical protein LQ343_001583 [Gyalolechia ehrenbergii]
MPANGHGNGLPLQPRLVKLSRHRLRSFSTRLRSFHLPPPRASLPPTPIQVICISDTHGTHPPVPPGDLLLHAGDLTEWGTFPEIQAQLDWLSAQPHKYKVVIAGNHDLLLDPNFRINHPGRWQQALKAVRGSQYNGPWEESRTDQDLQWGGIIYLQNTSTTLTFPHDDGAPERTVTIYGSPLTPQYGVSAFQYPKDQDVWTSTIPAKTDILITHGPPWGRLDGVKKSGCPFLAREVAKVRPRLMVFGHIHVGYGIEETVYDTVGRAHQGILGGWAGWPSLFKMAVSTISGRILRRSWRRAAHTTTFVNAAIVEGWEQYKVKNQAVVFSL